MQSLSCLNCFNANTEDFLDIVNFLNIFLHILMRDKAIFLLFANFLKILRSKRIGIIFLQVVS